MDFYKGSFFIIFKGQIISEQNGVIKFSKKQWNIARISALASKMGQIKKNKGNFIYQIINNH